MDKYTEWKYTGTWVPDSKNVWNFNSVEKFKDNNTAPYIGTWLPGSSNVWNVEQWAYAPTRR